MLYLTIRNIYPIKLYKILTFNDYDKIMIMIKL